MTAALLLCGDDDHQPLEYDSVGVLTVFLLDRLRKTGIPATNLYDINLKATLNERSILLGIDAGLHQEASDRIERRWAPLALQRVFRRYLHYRQYRERLAIWLEKTKPTKLVVSSRREATLIAAASVVCRSMGIALEVRNGCFDYGSGLDPYMFSETLPRKGDLDPRFLTGILGWWTSLSNPKLIYEPYPNLYSGQYAAVDFKWWKSVALTGRVRQSVKAILGRERGEFQNVDYHSGVDPHLPFLLEKSFWPSFSDDEQQAINSGLHAFRCRHADDQLDKLDTSLRAYFRSGRFERLIVLDCQIPHCRLLIQAGRETGLLVDYLPHGLTVEDYTPSTSTKFSPHRVLAWNESAARAYHRHGLQATTISHPRNASRCEPHSEWRGGGPPNRVLVLLPTAELLQTDRLERDFLEIHAAMVKLGIRNVAWKYHHSGKQVAERKKVAVSRLEEVIGDEITILPSDADTQGVMATYDLIVIAGLTSGIVEAVRFGIPHIIFHGETGRAGILDDLPIQKASSCDELVQAVLNFSFSKHRAVCEELCASLIGYPHPLDPGLNVKPCHTHAKEVMR